MTVETYYYEHIGSWYGRLRPDPITVALAPRRAVPVHRRYTSKAIVDSRLRPVDNSSLVARTVLHEGSRSDRPRCYAHTRRTHLLPMASSRYLAAGLVISQRKSTTTAISQYSYSAATDTRVANTLLHWPLTLTYDLDLTPGKHGHAKN